MVESTTIVLVFLYKEDIFLPHQERARDVRPEIASPLSLCRRPCCCPRGRIEAEVDKECRCHTI